MQSPAASESLPPPALDALPAVAGSWWKSILKSESLPDIPARGQTRSSKSSISRRLAHVCEPIGATPMEEGRQ